ncbi:hypothetical protein [Algoriphagus sp.]|uniref:hypothetical protein n=1 Tax=Algoriphagus sp. TaxID=1872435 RepID=UPI0027259E52|nr:hypothetical protein [Algoriphagus sp.]MDO8969022.1 hypothetical protein [Algoriphagus sp.]MDP3200253.1 hypothetical protein [Algoriphagus sp.]
MDPEAYLKAKIKICSILKETPVDRESEKGYVFGEGFLRKIEKFGNEYYKKSKGTLSVLSRRIALILDTLYPNQEHDPVDSLKGTAYLNLKKYSGTKTSSQKDLENVTKKDKGLLKEQIDEILEPDIILCGKTRHYLGFIYGGDIQFISEDASKKVKLFHLLKAGKPKRLIIEMYHPSHRSSEEEQMKKLEEVLLKYRNSENFLF